MKVDNSLNVVISYESKKDSKSRFFDILPSFLTDEKPILEQHNQRWTVPRFGEIWREVASIFDGDPDTFDALTSENIAVQSLSLLFMSIILFFVCMLYQIYTAHIMIWYGMAITWKVLNSQYVIITHVYAYNTDCGVTNSSAIRTAYIWY